MSIRQVREAVKKMYPTKIWSFQVDRMADNQVFAIYMRNVETLPDLPQKGQPPAQGTLF